MGKLESSSLAGFPGRLVELFWLALDVIEERAQIDETAPATLVWADKDEFTFDRRLKIVLFAWHHQPVERCERETRVEFAASLFGKADVGWQRPFFVR